MSSYYYDQLNKNEQKVYHAFYEGLENLKTSFSVPRLEASRLSDIYFMVRLDHPEIFYSVHFKYRFYNQADSMEIIPEYLFDKKKLLDQRHAMEARIAKLCLPAEKMSEEEKELYIHDFICRNITYDKLKKAYSHEIIGPLGHGVSVCEGIAKTVKILCDRLNIWCIIVLSQNNPQKNIKYRHAWNILRIGGKYYHLDATFDNSLGQRESVRYDYFNLSDSHIFRDHEPLIWPAVACGDASLWYYKKKKLAFTKYEDLEKRIGQYAKKKKDFVFAWRGGYLTKDVLNDIVAVIRREEEEKKVTALISLNYSQAVFRLRFEEKGEKQTDVVLQQANEGELYGPSEGEKEEKT